MYATCLNPTNAKIRCSMSNNRKKTIESTFIFALPLPNETEIIPENVIKNDIPHPKARNKFSVPAQNP